MRMFFKFKSSRGELNIVEDDLAFVNALYSEEKRQGHATGLMQNICQYADRAGMTLLLSVQSYGRGDVPDNHELQSFYERFGFERHVIAGGHPRKMIRRPSQKIHVL